jgi:hypothetical protein
VKSDLAPGIHISACPQEQNPVWKVPKHILTFCVCGGPPHPRTCGGLIRVNVNAAERVCAVKLQQNHVLINLSWHLYVERWDLLTSISQPVCWKYTSSLFTICYKRNSNLITDAFCYWHPILALISINLEVVLCLSRWLAWRYGSQVLIGHLHLRSSYADRDPQLGQYSVQGVLPTYEKKSLFQKSVLN